MKEIDFFRTQGDQKAYYNWFVNVAELTHPLSEVHTPAYRHPFTDKHASICNKVVIEEGAVPCVGVFCDDMQGGWHHKVTSLGGIGGGGAGRQGRVSTKKEK